MRATGEQRAARRYFLEVRALGGGVKTRLHPDDATRLQLGLFGLPAGEQADALRERVRAVKLEMISLVATPQSRDLDTRAVLEEGAA